MSLYLYAFLIFLTLLAVVGINVAILDHLKDIEGVKLLPLLLWVNFNLLVILGLVFLLVRKLYREIVQSRSSPLRRKLFLSLIVLFGFPIVVTTAVAVAGKSSYLRVFTDETLRGLLHSIENLQREMEEINIPPEEKEKFTSELRSLEETTSNLRDLVRQQKVLVINFLSFFLLVALAVFLGGVAVAAWLSRVISKEVEILSRSMERLAAGDFNVRIEPNQFPREKIEELRRLAENFNRMAERLRSLYKRLEREKYLFGEVFQNVSTGVALFDRRDGQLIDANESYKKHFKFDNLRELREWATGNDNLRYEEKKVGYLSLVFIEDLTPFVVNKRYRAWKEIASRLAHDVKNPLHGINLSLDLLEALLERIETENGILKNPDAFERFKEQFQRNARQIRKQIEYVSDLIESFNNLASEEEELKKERFPLKELLYEIKREFDGDRFKVLVEGEAAYIVADRRTLKRVFENLVRNAYEAIEKAGISPGIVRLRREGNLIHIIDNGPGIPPEKAETIFLPFTSSKGKGRGLGLFIAKKIVEEHGWTLKLLPPRKGEGAHFVIEVSPKDIKDRYR
ncbi:MAG TPA: HAMP domain-containing protein [Aquifex sp.]|nr:HAMP domain-containing protein [Aquifex sp.]